MPRRAPDRAPRPCRRPSPLGCQSSASRLTNRSSRDTRAQTPSNVALARQATSRKSRTICPRARWASCDVAEDGGCGQHRAEPSGPVPDRTRGQLREGRAVRGGPRRHVEVRLRIAAVARRQAHADRAGLVGSASLDAHQRGDVDVMRPAAYRRRVRVRLRGDEVAQQGVRARVPARQLGERVAVTAAKHCAVAHDVIGHLVRRPCPAPPLRASARPRRAPGRASAPASGSSCFELPTPSTITRVRSAGRSPRRNLRGVIPPRKSLPAVDHSRLVWLSSGHRRDQCATDRRHDLSSPVQLDARIPQRGRGRESRAARGQSARRRSSSCSSGGQRPSLRAGVLRCGRLSGAAGVPAEIGLRFAAVVPALRRRVAAGRSHRGDGRAQGDLALTVSRVGRRGAGREVGLAIFAARLYCRPVRVAAFPASSAVPAPGGSETGRETRDTYDANQ